MSTDYIPRKAGDFLEWARTLILYIVLHLTEFGIDQAVLTVLQDLFSVFEAAYQKAQNPSHNRADIVSKNEARDALEKALRHFVKAHLAYNDAVTNSDRVNMGLPLHDTTHTPVPPPSTRPEFEIDLSQFRQLIVNFHDQGSARHGKPDGVHGAEVRWDFTENPPVEVEELIHSEFTTKSPYTLNFNEGQRGKRVYICVRWENAKGEKGPWGEIVSAVVP
ncbi:MAG: hypothetical protein LBQ77_00920 [Treponema sp.]|nr:hypothetical protein [Treponema sp.]